MHVSSQPRTKSIVAFEDVSAILETGASDDEAEQGLPRRSISNVGVDQFFAVGNLVQ